MSEPDSLRQLLDSIPSSSAPAATARIVTDATVVAGAAVSAEGRSALAALATGELVDPTTAAVLQVQYLSTETLAWQAFLAGDTPGYLSRFRAARALAALYHAATRASNAAMDEVIREATGTGLPITAIEDVLQDYRTR